MTFTKRLPSKHIATLVSAGFLLLVLEPVAAQLPQYNCRPNAAGDGWICEDATAAEPPPVQGTATEVEEPATEADSDTNTEEQPESAPAPPAGDGEEAAEPPPDDGNGISARLYRPPEQEYYLDWQSRETMTAAQQQNLLPGCCGGFVDPLAGQVDGDADPNQAQTQFTSSAGLSQFSSEVINIDGDVVLRQGYRVVTNDRQTSINRTDNTVSLEGDVRFREPGLLLKGDSAFVDSDNNSNRIDNAQYVLHDYGAHGNAGSVTYDGEAGLITIENGEFSRCEPQREFWSLRARSITLDPQRSRGYAEDFSLRLGNVPVFYYPFTLAFPLGDERISGFLAPSLGSTNSGGTDFELPYYFNLAPHADATIAPRLISDRGIMASAEFRYLASWSMNTLNVSHLANDDFHDPATANLPGSDSPPVADRWFIGYDHQGILGPFSTYVDYNAASDSDYFFDLGGSGLNIASRTHLNRQGRIAFNSPLLRAGLNVQRFQIIDPFTQSVNINKPYDRLPEFTFSSDTYLGAGFSVGIRGQVTSFDRELAVGQLTPEQISNGALVTGERANLEPELNWAWETPGLFLRGSAKYKYMDYRLENQASGTPEAADVGVQVYSLDTGLVFDRALPSGTIHTLEPRIFYLYSEFQDQSRLPLFDTSELNFSFNQLFRDDRFAGGDRIADADQVTLALTSRLLNSNGVERARFSVGQIHYFDERRVNLSSPLRTLPPRQSLVADESALVGEMALLMGENWQLSSDLQWNEQQQDVDEGNFRLRYQSGLKQIFNFAYRFRRLLGSPNFTPPPGVDPRIKQTDLSGVWPVNENWTLLGRWNYDHSNERNLESFAGVEWSNCCATIRLIGREWVDENELFVPNSEPNRGIFVQFTLHGLGNIAGGGLSTLLSDGIRGFRESDYE